MSAADDFPHAREILRRADSFEGIRLFGEIDRLRSELAGAGEALRSIGNSLAFSSRDHAEHHRDAWIYGIVLGWDPDPDDEPDDEPTAMEEMIERHDWDDDAVARLRRLHGAAELALVAFEQSRGRRPRPRE